MKKLLNLLFKKLLNILSNKGLSKFPFLVRVYNLIYKKIVPVGINLINIDGLKLYADFHDGGVGQILVTHGSYRKYETELLKEILKPNMVAVDIGANIGYYSLIASRLVGSNGKVYAFEPETDNYELLKKNIEVNDLNNIIPEKKAVLNVKEQIEFYLSKYAQGGHSVSKKNVPLDYGQEEIETIRLDGYFEEYVGNFNINFMKIYAQGSEGLIIKGAQKILKNNNLKIFMEFWPEGLRNAGTDPQKLLEGIQNLGFKIKIIDNINNELVQYTISEIVEIYERPIDRKNFTNIFLEK